VIVLDTNVISEMFKPTPDLHVTEWLDRQELETLHISAVTQAELKYGVYRLPEGARRKRLLSSIEEVLALLGAACSRLMPLPQISWRWPGRRLRGLEPKWLLQMLTSPRRRWPGDLQLLPETQSISSLWGLS